LDSERSSDPNKKVRKDGCKVFTEVANALYDESDDFDYFSTTMRCLLFSRVFVNTITFAYVTLSPVIASVAEHTIPFLKLAQKINELSSEASMNYINMEGSPEQPIEVQQTPVQEEPKKTTPKAETKTEPTPEPVKPKDVPVAEVKKPVSEQSKTEDKKKEQTLDEGSVVSTLKLRKPVEDGEQEEIISSTKVQLAEIPPHKSKKEPQQTEAKEKQAKPIDVTETEEYKKVKKDNQLLRDDVDHLRDQVKSLKQQLEKEEEKTSDLERQVTQNQKVSKDTSKKLNESQSAAEQLQKEKDRIEKQLLQSQEEVQHLKEKLIHEESLRDELNEKLNENKVDEELQLKLKKVEGELKQLQEMGKSSTGSKSGSSDIEKEGIQVAKIQYEELKQVNTDLSQRLDEIEKRNIELEEEIAELEKKKISDSDPSHSLIEKLKSKNKLLLEQLNSAKRENMKAREKSTENIMKTLESKIHEYLQAAAQIQSSSPQTKVAVGKEEDDESASPQEKLNMQKLKEKVTDLTNKLNAARKKTTELEVARMKWQEGEKVAKQKIANIENELEELKQKLATRENILKEEIEQLQKEVGSCKESEQKVRSDLRKLEKEKQELEQSIKKEHATRKKSVMVMQQVQQVQENNNVLLRNELVQAKEQIELLERELKKATGMKLNSNSFRSQSIAIQHKKSMSPNSYSPMSPEAVFTQPKKLEESKQEALTKQREANQAKRQSVLINRNIFSQLKEENATQSMTSISSNDSSEESSHTPQKVTVVEAEEEEYEMDSPRGEAPHEKKDISDNIKPKFDKQGYLYKKGPKINIYKKRYFKIEGHNLLYYNDMKDVKPLGSIDLRTALTDSAPEKCSSKRRYVFKVEIPSRAYYMSAPSKEEMEEWIVSLDQLIQKLKSENSFK